MRALSAAELLQVWERGQGQPPVQRALLLLAAACPEMPPEELVRLSIGRRDSRLLSLREWTFGSQLVSLAVCPACGERVEICFNVADVRAPAASLPSPGEATGTETEPLAITVADYEIGCRLPNSLDLAALADAEDLTAARRRLFECCVLSSRQHGEQRPVAQLPDELVATLVARMAQADPQADTQLALSCPNCGHGWLAAFDIVAFFWSELEAWAMRILHEVHTLASTYGWREADILAMSPWRRQAYLNWVLG